MENPTTLSIDEARQKLEATRADIRSLRQRHERNRQLNAANAQVVRSISRLQRDIQLVKRQFVSLGRSWEDDFRPA